MSVDLFLYQYFREAERARSPQCVSAKAVVRRTYESARAAEEWRVWSLLVMGVAERRLTEEHCAVLAAVYLGLTKVHFEIIKRRGQGRPTVRQIKPGHAPSGEGDIGSMTSWRGVCMAIWGKRTGALDRKARRLFGEARAAVREALDGMQAEAA